ncbi:alpha/beta hydrolase [uncultured Pontibacter sp.]|uniref:alpha/beta hydrolase n=1 Tax=uncultured Pontibacter sp. TaxID=453356 RepID=UPI0026175A67|nr:alpha/beta hydrolase [uncultured Pontibacter sp.]
MKTNWNRNLRQVLDARWLKIPLATGLLLGAVACASDTTNEQATEATAAEASMETQDTDAIVANLTPAKPKPAWAPEITNQMQVVLEALDSLQSGPPLSELSAEQARKAPTPADAAMAVVKKNNIPQPPMQVDTTGQSVPVDGGNIHVRVYTPQNSGSSNPGIVYYHGGGWVIAGIDTYHASARALAEKTGAVVVSVAYRQAPEHKFPTAHNDSFAAYKWVIDNAQSLKINPDKVAVAGESAGGNLAAAVSMMARDNNTKMPVHQLLVYPIAGHDFNTESYNKYAEAKPLSKAGMQWFFDKYLAKPADAQNPMISLVSAPNLKNLPPATIINAQLDPLMTEGQMLADKLKDAGIPVETKVYDGVTHEFFGMATVLPQAKEAQQMAVDELKKSFNK